MDAWLSAQTTMVTQLNALVTWIQTVANQIETWANDAEAGANTATTIVNYAGVWSGLTGALSANYSVHHDDGYWRSLVNIADITASEPSRSNTDWAFVSYTSAFGTAATYDVGTEADDLLTASEIDSRIANAGVTMDVRTGYVTGTTATHGTASMSETGYVLNVSISALNDYTKAVVLPPHGGVLGSDSDEAVVTMTLTSNTNLRISFISTITNATWYYAIRYYIMELT